MKFRPSAIISLMKIDINLSKKYIPVWLNSELTPYWPCRYATLMCMEDSFKQNDFSKFLDQIVICSGDNHKFVKYKASAILSKI